MFPKTCVVISVRYPRNQRVCLYQHIRQTSSGWARQNRHSTKGKPQHPQHQCFLEQSTAAAVLLHKGLKPLTLPKAPLFGLQEHRLLQGLILSTQMFLEGWSSSLPQQIKPPTICRSRCTSESLKQWHCPGSPGQCFWEIYHSPCKR